MKKLIPFDIDKAKQPGVRVVNMQGTPIRIVCFDGDNEDFPVISSKCEAYTANGCVYGLFKPSSFDLQLEIESTLREWKIEEVPVGALIRPKGYTNCVGIIVSKTESNVYVSIGNRCCSSFSLSYLFSEYECSIDLFKPDSEKKWLPCGTEYL